jgi:hypothetical protein
VGRSSDFLKHFKPAFYAGYQQAPLRRIEAKSIPHTYSWLRSRNLSITLRSNLERLECSPAAAKLMT